MIVLNSFSPYSLLPLNFSECDYLTKVVDFLKKDLNDDYSLQLIYPGAVVKIENLSKYNIAIHISNEVNYDDSFYNYFDYIFRFYLSEKCDYKRVFPINIGYNSGGFDNNLSFRNNLELNLRENDLFFYGNRVVRKLFYNHLKMYINKYDIIFSDMYRGGVSINEYRDKLANSKICLTPGGASPETFRYTEAFASGCIVVTDFFSDVWYMEGSPSIFVNNWADFTQDFIDDILFYIHLGDYKERALNYYETKLSPRANANYILNRLSS